MTTTNTAYKPFTSVRIVATRGAVENVPYDRLMQCLGRHLCGDWGVVGPEDAAENNLSTHEGFRILSAYPIDPAKPCKGHGDNCLWIVTEADRSVTILKTILENNLYKIIYNILYKVSRSFFLRAVMTF